MHAHDLLARDGEHAERVVVAQIGLDGERQIGDRPGAVEVAGADAGLLEARAVEGHVLHRPPQRRPQALYLHLAQLVDGHPLDVGVPVPAAGLVRVARDRRSRRPAHSARTSSSVMRATLSLSSSIALSMSRTAKQMFMNEML